MTALADEIADLANDSSRQLGIAIRVDQGYDTRVVTAAADQPMMAASLAKLGIAAYVTHRVTIGAVHWEDVLVLTDGIKRRGTGVLYDFPAGTRLTLRRAFELMLSVSDNTAANVVLAAVGSQRTVNTWLALQGITQSGLADRDDRLFMSTTTTADQVLRVLDLLWATSPEAVAAMRRNHNPKGLRYSLAPPSWWSQRRLPAVKWLAARSGGRPRLLSALIWCAARLPANRIVANKDGALNHEGWRYRHDAGWITTATGDRATVVVLTSFRSPEAPLPGIWRWFRVQRGWMIAAHIGRLVKRDLAA